MPKYKINCRELAVILKEHLPTLDDNSWFLLVDHMTHNNFDYTIELFHSSEPNEPGGILGNIFIFTSKEYNFVVSYELKIHNIVHRIGVLDWLRIVLENDHKLIRVFRSL